MNAEHTEQIRVEDNIDAALKMLGETHPPADIVSRVHQRLETAAMSQRARSGRRLLIPAVGIVASALALVVILTQMHRAPETQTPAETAKLVATFPLEHAIAVPPAAPVAPENFEEGKRSVQPPAVRRVRREHREYRHAANLLSYPLTRQEKLLVQFAQTTSPAELQMLNPEYQAKIEAQQEAEFAAYLKSGDGYNTQETAN